MHLLCRQLPAILDICVLLSAQKQRGSRQSTHATPHTAGGPARTGHAISCFQMASEVNLGDSWQPAQGMRGHNGLCCRDTHTNSSSRLKMYWKSLYSPLHPMSVDLPTTFSRRKSVKRASPPYEPGKGRRGVCRRCTAKRRRPKRTQRVSRHHDAILVLDGNDRCTSHNRLPVRRGTASLSLSCAAERVRQRAVRGVLHWRSCGAAHHDAGGGSG